MAVARLDWTLFISCPACDASVDLVDQDEDGCFSHAIFNNKWEEAKGESVYCDECSHEFTVEGIEY